MQVLQHIFVAKLKFYVIMRNVGTFYAEIFRPASTASAMVMPVNS